jgi:hypothetical protein
MRSIFEKFTCVITTHVLETLAAVVGIAGAILAAIGREQIRAVILWAAAPLIQNLPWNMDSEAWAAPRSALSSEVTIVDVVLLDVAGRHARYQKISSYRALGNLRRYQEGVTAEGNLGSFFTERGLIVRIEQEHGFCVCDIEMPETIERGERFTNVFGADLHSCFTKGAEHWTQELAFPTKHLTIQVHFPENRPPKSVVCSRLGSTLDTRRAAKLIELYGLKSIIWEIEHPKTRDVYKLEWTW